jgi:hypothetical protein
MEYSTQQDRVYGLLYRPEFLINRNMLFSVTKCFHFQAGKGMEIFTQLSPLGRAYLNNYTQISSF